MAKYDLNQNQKLEFDEFRKLYLDCLHGGEDRARVRRAVMERFRTNEELRLLAMAEAEAMQLEQRRLQLLAKRDEMKIVSKEQKMKRNEVTYLDCDATARRKKSVDGGKPAVSLFKQRVQQALKGNMATLVDDLKKAEGRKKELDDRKSISAKKKRSSDRARKVAAYKATRGVDVERQRLTQGWEASQEAKRDAVERRRGQALRSLRDDRGFDGAVRSSLYLFLYLHL
jgi:hypothetical protein